MSARTISIATHKGGTGKTVTAMGLSSALTRAKGKKTLLVDLDPQGHSTLGLGVELNDSEPMLRELFEQRPLPIDHSFSRSGLKTGGFGGYGETGGLGGEGFPFFAVSLSYFLI